MNGVRPRSYEFALVGLLVLLWGGVGLNRIGLGWVLPQIRAEFAISNLEASLLLAGTSVTWAFASWGGGWLSDRYGRRPVLIPAMLFICLMTAAMGIAGGFWSMFIIRDLLGIGDGIGWSVGEATIGDETFPIGPDMSLICPPYTWHGYRNLGSGYLRVLAILPHPDAEVHREPLPSVEARA